MISDNVTLPRFEVKDLNRSAISVIAVDKCNLVNRLWPVGPPPQVESETGVIQHHLIGIGNKPCIREYREIATIAWPIWGEAREYTFKRLINTLNDIAIYTYEEEVPLRKVFANIAEKENGKETINHKESNDTLLSFFGEVLPDFDDERVYASNVKKIVQWYNILVNAKFNFTTLEEEEETTEE